MNNVGTTYNDNVNLKYKLNLLKHDIDKQHYSNVQRLNKLLLYIQDIDIKQEDKKLILDELELINNGVGFIYSALVNSTKNLSFDISEEKENLKIDHVVKDALHSALSLRKFTPVIKLECKSNLVYMGVKNELYRIFFNLIINALDSLEAKYIETGKLGELIISVKQEAYFELKITITDTGIGIPDNLKGRIFDSYFSTKKNKYNSVGLGLTIVKNAVKFHKGKIQVESKENEFTTFTITL